MIRILLFLILISGFSYGKDNLYQKFSADSLIKKTQIHDEWFSRDKGLHLAGSFISSGLVIMSAKRFMDLKSQNSKVLSVSVSFSLGLGKEFYDSRQQNNHFSYKDLTADIMGIVLALIVFK